VVVNPGDIIVGDADGVVVIRPDDARSVLEKASAKSRAEQQTLLDIENGIWARDWVDSTLAEKGCVPGC
jgi:regulator of RNase E activity RraA